MKVGDLVRFIESAQRTEGELGVVIDASPDVGTHQNLSREHSDAVASRYAEILWPSGSRIFESKMFLEVINESR